jgi:uncharacterized protein (TIGR04255 family)
MATHSTTVRPPVFERPPITEVVCGVAFETLRGLLAPHLGLLWEKYRPEFSRCQEAVPLLIQIEKPEGTLGEAEIVDVPPLPRVQLRNETGDAMIQVQRERFHYNWQKVCLEDAYPRFEAIFALYREKLDIFQSFLSANDLGTLVARQYELTYVNHILRGDGWDTPADIGTVFPDLVWRRLAGRPEPESVMWRAAFKLPDDLGRLHVSIRSAQRTSDGKDLLLADFTARGIVGTDEEGMAEWFKRAHDSIVVGFEDLTSPTVQKDLWGRVK